MKVTVFTPTYNRAYILGQLKDSLLRQTCKDFEWLIVDDGSNDETKALVKEWSEKIKDFTIQYYWVKNGGKCRAINLGLQLAKGTLFFTMDSDDYLTDDAIEKIIKWEQELPKNEKYAGIVANTGYNPTDTVNTFFKEKYIDATLLDMYTYVENQKLVLGGERALIFYTDIHRKYQYPEFENENFMTEAVTWNRMANDGYKVRFYNDIIWIFEYQNDGLTRTGHKLFVNNPYGYALWMKEKTLFTKDSFLVRSKLYYSFYCEMKNYYSISQIADFLGVDYYKIAMIAFVKKVKDKVIIR